ncbi:MAG: hypothetical protein KO202_05680 [Methanobacteriaceae archaeon]|jgi:predicted AAA+ superfamily ATPase|nr:hypothetical protein [Methanobacteriaceae archaeon]
MNEKILKEIKKNKYTTIEKIETYRILTELKNVFRTYNEEESLKRFETLLNKSKQFIKVLRTYIHKKIIPEFQRLTNYTKNNFISRTSNQAEQWYNNSTKHQNKKKYKTTQGLLEYLALKMTKNQL